MGNYTATPPPPFAPPPFAPRPLTRSERRAARAASRRRSFLGPIFLVVLGVVALLIQLGRLPWQTALLWFGNWWPLLLIAAGLLLVLEWALDRRMQERQAQDHLAFDAATQEGRPPAGFPVYGPRHIGSGVIWLLVLLALVGASARSTQGLYRGYNGFSDGHAPGLRFDWLHAVGNAHDSDDSLTQAIAPGGSVTIDNPQGDITVAGTSDDGQMHMDIHKEVYAYNDGDATQREGRLQPVLQASGNDLAVRVPYIEDGKAGLSVTLPKGTALTLTTTHGDVRVSGMHGAVTVNGNRGDVDLSELEGAVIAHMHSSDATVSAHGIAGSLTVDGHTGDLNVSDVRGPVSLNGNFFGTTHLEKVQGPLLYHTSRTDLQIGRLDGEMEFDTGSDFHADSIVGPVLLKTSDRVITLDRVQGDVQVQNSNGAVTLTSLSPLGAVSILNKRGSVDVGVPANASFTLQAATHHGEIENDFALHPQGSDGSPELSATVGQGGPSVHIQTSDGDVTLRKIAATSLPVPPLPVPPLPVPPLPGPTPPAPPAISVAPKTPVHKSK